MGGGTRQEQLALGETPNLAARLQGIAAPNTLVISASTFQLLGGFFACQPLGAPSLKGLAQPLAVYTGWTPLVGREQEIGLLLERWAQVKEGVGQVVLLSGEAGIGKSRLVQVLQEYVASEPQAWLTPCQCSPYYQNTALYPMIDLLERVALRFEQEESPQHKLRKLEGFVVQYGLPLAEVVPLLAALLSLPLPADYTPWTMSPEKSHPAQGSRDQHDAETCFQQGLDVSRRQEAKALELRAAMSLSRLWQRQGKRTEAYDLLAPIYSCFTEGFDTADLQEAKVLLEALA